MCRGHKNSLHRNWLLADYPDEYNAPFVLTDSNGNAICDNSGVAIDGTVVYNKMIGNGKTMY